ncbi:MAG: phenylacetate-CoA oxygenase subunit PaaI [Sphingobacteriales bacterium]|nr:MAG: phenylacetate-CoA oxygenase subunit PaaI [Sphingobacteriales bacterium]
MSSSSLLIHYTLSLADNALILGHRNSEWTGHGPVLEQDIALSNIALDLIGQARNLYQHAAALMNDGSTEDTLAYLRDARGFYNCQLVEQPNGDWGHTVTRQFFFSVYQYYLYGHLEQSKDEMLAAIAAKSVKEVAYHLRWSSEWMIRLGDGTNESHQRMQRAVDALWPYTGELYDPAAYESALATEGIAADPATFSGKAQQKLNEVLALATLQVPQTQWMHNGGKTGIHSEHLGYLLAEMQFLQRAYPGAEW